MSMFVPLAAVYLIIAYIVMRVLRRHYIWGVYDAAMAVTWPISLTFLAAFYAWCIVADWRDAFAYRHDPDARYREAGLAVKPTDDPR